MSLDLITKYKESLQDIYDHVGFKEDWVVCPLDDCKKMFWDTDGQTVHFAKTEEEFNSQEGNYYKDEVYTQRFYDKHIYEGEDFTMIFCDPHTDGMKWFRLFDNSKRRKFEESGM